MENLYSKFFIVLYIMYVFCYTVIMKTLMVTRTAMKDLKGLPQKDREAVMAKFRAYVAGEQQDVVRVIGTNFLRLRHGDWRAIFEESETDVTILAVSHRREAYR